MTRRHEVNYLVDHQKKYSPSFYSGSILLSPVNGVDAPDSHSNWCCRDQPRSLKIIHLVTNI